MFLLAAGLVRGAGRPRAASRSATTRSRRARWASTSRATRRARSRSARRTRASAARCSRCRSASSPRSRSRSRCRSPSWRRSSSAGWRRSAGALFGALFIEFVPVYAADVDEALAGVIYGGVLILVHVRRSPGGRDAGAASRRITVAARARPRGSDDEEAGAVHRLGWSRCWRSRCSRAGAGAARTAAEAAAAAAASDPGITDTEIKLGGTYPFSGPASAYARDRRGRQGALRVRQLQGRRRRAQDRVHDARRRLRAAAGRRQRAPAGRAGEGVRALQHARHAEQPRDLGLHQPAEGAAAVRRHRRVGLGLRRRRAPVHDRLAAQLRHRGEDLRGVPQGRTSRTPRSRCSTRTTASARTCSAASRRASRARASRSSPRSPTR